MIDTLKIASIAVVTKESETVTVIVIVEASVIEKRMQKTAWLFILISSPDSKKKEKRMARTSMRKETNSSGMAFSGSHVSARRLILIHGRNI